MSSKPVYKYQLAAWPPGPRFIKVDGRDKSTVLWRRDYFGSPAGANRAAPGIHKRFPEARIEIVTFVDRGFCWVAGSDDTEVLYWCSFCNHRLNWIDDQWHCPRCGNEWHDEQVRGEAAK